MEIKYTTTFMAATVIKTLTTPLEVMKSLITHVHIHAMQLFKAAMVTIISTES